MATTMFSKLFRPSIAVTDNTGYVCNACKRHQSSYRRTRKALRVKPDPSFLPSTTETSDHIIFNPPSSTPNVYHTPLKFLPATDPRRKFHTSASAPSITASAASSISSVVSPASYAQAQAQAPPVRPQNQKKYHLTQSQIDEIRALRAEDPKKWTRVRLAEEFECSQFFVSLCCSAPEVKAEQDKALEEIKRRWGRKKTEAREARQERKELWGRDA